MGNVPNCSERNKKMKLKTKNIHIAIIIAGILFNCISIFHSNIWFDEAYSVGLASKSFVDIWKIGGNDVHPVLYYWILHIIYLITNGISEIFKISNVMNFSIIAYRIFSAVCISILGCIGYTHIRKDFGEKVGILFSFFGYFLPVICIYTAEVRMYSFAVVLVTILAIYAYRLSYKKQDSIKNWLIFGITSLACIYVHYYGLMAAGIINVILLITLIKQQRKTAVYKILTLGAIQFIAYIPWIMYFMKQLKHVSKGFWIGFEFPKSLMEIVSSQFIGNLSNNIGFIISILIYIYLGVKAYKTMKNKQDWKVGITAISIYIAVIIAALVVTVFMKTSILYFRYLFVITGLLIFFISYFLAKENKKITIYAICGITLVLAVFSNYKQIVEVYDNSNIEPILYMKENIKKDDVIVFYESNFGTGSVVALNNLENKQFYYNPSDWGIKEAYRAFGEQFEVYTNTEFLKQCNNRVWIIDTENFDYYNMLFNNEDFKLISNKVFKIKYEGYNYNFVLVERVK